MNPQAKGGPAAPPAHEPAGGRVEMIRYFRIDFDRCVIRRGTRVKPATKPPSLVEAR